MRTCPSQSDLENLYRRANEAAADVGDGVEDEIGLWVELGWEWAYPLAEPPDSLPNSFNEASTSEIGSVSRPQT